MRKYSPDRALASQNPAPTRTSQPRLTDGDGNLLPTRLWFHLRLAALSPAHYQEFLHRKAARRTEGRA